MIDPRKLVETARILNAGQNGQPPAEEAIRRAVSTGYYALFHCVLKAGAERFIGASSTSVAFEVIYRGFNHSRINKVFVEVDKHTLSAAYQKRLRRTAVSQNIRDFAAVFVPMQELRHLADYSPVTHISQAEAAELIDNVEMALQTFANADSDEKMDLLALMLVDMRAS